MGVARGPAAAPVRGAWAIGLLVLTGVLLAGCERQESRSGAQPSPAAAGAVRTLNIGAQTGAISAQTLDEVRAKTGLRVQLRGLASQRELESRLLAGGSGFDVVVVTSQFIAGQVRAGLFQRLERRQLPNLRQIDAELLTQLSTSDPGNELAVPYRQRTTGIAVDRQQFTTLMGDADPYDWSLVFDARHAARFAGCGLYVPDAAQEMVALALLWLGRDPNSEQPEDLAAAAAALLAIKPHVQRVEPSSYSQKVLAGKPCLAVARGDTVAGSGLDYGVPAQGTIAWVDVLAIPADARQVRAAHAFIDTLIEAERARAAATSAAVPARSVLLLPHSEAHAAEVARLWARLAAR